MFFEFCKLIGGNFWYIVRCEDTKCVTISQITHAPITCVTNLGTLALSSQKWPKICKKSHFAMVISTTSRIQLCYLVKVATFFHKNSWKNSQIFSQKCHFAKTSKWIYCSTHEPILLTFWRKVCLAQLQLWAASIVGDKKSEVAFNFGRELVKLGGISFSRGKNLPFVRAS